MVTLEQWKLQAVPRSAQKLSPSPAEPSESYMLSPSDLSALVNVHLARVGGEQPLITSDSSLATSVALEPAHLQPPWLPVEQLDSRGTQGQMEGSGDPRLRSCACSLGLRSSSVGGEVHSTLELSSESHRPQSAGRGQR
jgi:hypothetical protein